MGIVKKQGIIGSVLLYIGFALGTVNLVFLFPYVFDPNQFGLTRVLISIAFVSAQFAQLSLPTVIIKFFPHFKDDAKQHHGLLAFALLVAAAGFLLFIGLFVALKPQILEAYREKSVLLVDYYYFIFPITLFMVLFNVFDAYTKSLLNITVPIFSKEIAIRASNMLFILLYYWGLIGFELFLVLFVSAYVVSAIILVGYLKKQGKLYLRPDFRFLRPELLREIFPYAGFTLLSSSTRIMVTNIDVIMLGYLAGLDNTAIYAVAFFIGTVIQIPQRSLTHIAQPLVSGAWKRNDLEAIDELYKKSALTLQIAGTFLLLGIWCNVDNILGLLPKTYEAGKYVVLLIGVGKLFNMSPPATIVITSFSAPFW